MSETLITPEQQQRPVDAVHSYLCVLRGKEVQEYRAAEGMLDDVMYNNTPGYRIGHTPHLTDALQDLLNYPNSDRLQRFRSWHRGALMSIPRDMILGKKFPLDQFGEVIDDLTSTMAVTKTMTEPEVDYRLSSIRRWIRSEILDVYDSRDLEIATRCGEALKHVAYASRHFRQYGRVMTRAAKLEFKIKS